LRLQKEKSELDVLKRRTLGTRTKLGNGKLKK
jgi:hypothetical protein